MPLTNVLFLLKLTEHLFWVFYFNYLSKKKPVVSEKPSSYAARFAIRKSLLSTKTGQHQHKKAQDAQSPEELSLSQQQYQYQQCHIHSQSQPLYYQPSGGTLTQQSFDSSYVSQPTSYTDGDYYPYNGGGGGYQHYQYRGMTNVPVQQPPYQGKLNYFSDQLLAVDSIKSVYVFHHNDRYFSI